jgi:hypothetical protein
MRQRTGILRGGKDHVWSLVHNRGGLWTGGCITLKEHKTQCVSQRGWLWLCHVFSHRLPTEARRLRVVVGFLVDRVCGTRARFLRVLQHTLPIILLSAPHSSIVQGWYSGPISGRCTKRTQSYFTPRTLKNLCSILEKFHCVWYEITYHYCLRLWVTPDVCDSPLGDFFDVISAWSDFWRRASFGQYM